MVENLRQICDGCPAAAAYDAALEILMNEQKAGGEELHRSEDRHKAAFGGVMLAKTILQAVVERIGCPNPVNSDSNYIVCPHSRTVSDAHSIIMGPGINPNIAYENIGEGSKPTRTGQYL